MDTGQEFRDLISRHAQPGDASTPLEGVRVMASDRTTEPVHSIYEPSVAIVAQGEKRTILGDTVFSYGAGEYLVVPIDLPIAGHVSKASAAEPFLAMGVTLRPSLVGALLLELAGGGGRGAAPQGLAVSKVDAGLLDPFVRMLRLLDAPRDAAFLQPMLEREIIWRLLQGEQGPRVRQIGLADSRLAQIRQAIQIIRAGFDKPLRMDALARAAGMSVTSFNRHFRAATTLSPLQYQKQIRLQEARSRLLSSATDIASIGFDVGYDSPSQFSREYSRLFGAPPGKDLIRLRGPGFGEGARV